MITNIATIMDSPPSASRPSPGPSLPPPAAMAIGKLEIKTGAKKQMSQSMKEPAKRGQKPA